MLHRQVNISLDSNTTNVKVKPGLKRLLLLPGIYSNTTNVKVKLSQQLTINLLCIYSNTTNVKVKPKKN